MPSDLQNRKDMQSPWSKDNYLFSRALTKIQTICSSLTFRNLLACHCRRTSISFRAKAHVPRSEANFEPAISFPEVIFGGAGVLEVRNHEIQDGVVLEASRSKVGKYASFFPYCTVLWHSEVHETLFIRSAEWRVFFMGNSMWIYLILPLESRGSINQFCTSASKSLNACNLARY